MTLFQMTYLLADAQEPEIPLLVKNKGWYASPSEDTEERIDPPSRSAYLLADQFLPQREVRNSCFIFMQPVMGLKAEDCVIQHF